MREVLLKLYLRLIAHILGNYEHVQKSRLSVLYAMKNFTDQFRFNLAYLLNSGDVPYELALDKSKKYIQTQCRELRRGIN